MLKLYHDLTRDDFPAIIIAIFIMPKTKSAQKALRQNVRRNALNVSRKSTLKSVVKGFSILLKEKKVDEATQTLPNVYKAIDKMEKVHLIKKGKADRMKSRLTKKLVSQKSGS